MKRIALEDFFLSFMPVIISNTLISIVISFPLLTAGDLPKGLFYVCLGVITFISHYFLLNLVIGLLIYAISGIMPGKSVISLKIFIFFLLQLVLLVDTRIYTLYHYHINSLVWNVIATQGLSDSVILGRGTVMAFLGFSSVIFIVEILITIFLNRFYNNTVPEKRSRFLRVSRICCIVGVCLIVTDKGMFAYADLVNDTNITGSAKLYPLYQPLTVKGFAERVLGIEVNRERDYVPLDSSAGINYPKEKLVFSPLNDKRFNIIILVLEGLRFDMLTEEIMPNIWAFGQKNLIYSNHYSGGNGSRFGIFSLMYGIYGTYWHNFLARRISPVLIDTLIDSGYDFKILSSTSLTFPEFRKTVFLKLDNNIVDNFSVKETVQKDRVITEKLINYISSRSSHRPFFAFLFYNSSHQSYKYPEEFEKFRPVIRRKDINYFIDTGNDNAHMIRNRYKNAIYYNDYLVGKIISSLEKDDLLDNTIVLITGDHGEEFYENGYFGHTSAFNDYQTKTTFVLHIPGIEHRVVTRTTSHADLVPTLLPLLGCISRPEVYSQGISLLSDEKHAYVISSQWDKAAFIDDRLMIVFSTELYNIGSFEVRRRRDYALIENTSGIMKQKERSLLDVIQKMSEFYK